MDKPLFIVTGTSGAGKTTVIPELRKRLKGFAIYDGDSVVGDDYNVIKCNWLRIAKSNYESGIKTVICLTIIPENLVDCDQVKYFSNIYYINLEISDEQIRNRLANRGWNEEVIQNYVDFSNWLKNNKDKAFDPPLFSIHSRDKSVSEIATEIVDFIKSK